MTGGARGSRRCRHGPGGAGVWRPYRGGDDPSPRAKIGGGASASCL
jgi:hypothetical protein